MKIEIYLEAVSATIAGSCQYGSSDYTAVVDGCYNAMYEDLKATGSTNDQIYVYAEFMADALLLGEDFETKFDKYTEQVEQFLCQGCNWWSFQGETQDEHGNCSDCVEE